MNLKHMNFKNPKGLIGLGALTFALFYPCIANCEEHRGESSFSQFSRLFPSAKIHKIPDVAHFYAGNRGFTLDRVKRRQVLLKFDSNDEVWVLNSISGPRGDEFLRNDVGQVVLRITSLGGITLFASSDSGGVAAEVSGNAKRIFPQKQVFSGSLQDAVNRSTARFIGHDISKIRIEATGGLPSYLVYDALERAADGLHNVPAKYLRSKKYRIHKVRVNRAPNPFVVSQDGVIEIGLTPGIGYAGRPSSVAVTLAVMGSR